MSAAPGSTEAQAQPPPVAHVPIPDEVWARYAAVPRRVRPGNRVALLRDGRATFPEMLAAIAKASRHINLASYMFRSDSTGKVFAEALSAKARAGVQVNLLFDAIGSSDAEAGLFDRMRGAGVEVIEFHPIRPWLPRWGWWRRDHRKILVVDGEVGFAGGVNIADVFSKNTSC